MISFGTSAFVSIRKSIFGRSFFFNRSAARQSTKKARLYFALALSSKLSAPRFPISILPLARLNLPASHVRIDKKIRLRETSAAPVPTIEQQPLLPIPYGLTCFCEFAAIEEILKCRMVLI